MSLVGKIGYIAPSLQILFQIAMKWQFIQSFRFLFNHYVCVSPLVSGTETDGEKICPCVFWLSCAARDHHRSMAPVLFPTLCILVLL
jgi:hypothetical protein